MIQLNKPLIVVIGLLALGALGLNLYEDPKVSHLFGMEINDWLYRAFWIVIVALCIYNYIHIERNTLKNRSKSKSKLKSKH